MSKISEVKAKLCDSTNEIETSNKSVIELENAFKDAEQRITEFFFASTSIDVQELSAELSSCVNNLQKASSRLDKALAELEKALKTL